MNNKTNIKRNITPTVFIIIISLIGVSIVFGVFILNTISKPKKEKYELDTELYSYDFIQKWEDTDTPHKVNLLLTTKCEIKSINYTLDFYNEDKVIIRTLKETQHDLKRNKTYAFSYKFQTNEKNVSFTLINGEIKEHTRNNIDYNKNLQFSIYYTTKPLNLN